MPGDPRRPDHGHGRHVANSRLAALIIAATVGVFAIPIVVDLAINPRRVFGYLVPDVFYYLTIARNHHEIGIWSFDGEHATNGYHPLWQWLLRPVWGLIAALDAEPAIFPLLVLASVAMIAAAIALLGGAMLREKRSISPLFPLLVPGFAALISTPLYQPEYDREALRDPAAARPIFTTLWSFANGMETPLLLLAFAGCVLFFVRRPKLDSNAAALSLAGLLLITTFARLDHVFFAGIVLLAYLVPAWRARERETLRRALLAGAVFSAGVLVYMLANKLAYGVSMPVSGVSKSSFPRVSFATLRTLNKLLVDPSDGWLMNGARLFQLLFPIVIAVVYLLLNVRVTRKLPYVELRPGRDRFDALLCWTALAVLALHGYNTFYVLLIHTGPWYFPLSAVFVSLAFITSLERWLPIHRSIASPRRAAIVLTLVVLASAGYFKRAQYRPLYLAEQATFYYDEAPRIREYYQARGEVPKLVEFDDGIVTFATGFPAMSGHGLALDKEAMLAKQRGELMKLAVERGYNHIASLNYVQLTEPGPLRSYDAFKAYKWIKKDERRQLEFVPEYHSPESGFAIFEVVFKQTPAALDPADLNDDDEDEDEDEDESSAN